jgi:hypothetical protein
MSRLVDAFEHSRPERQPSTPGVHVAKTSSSSFLVYPASARAHQAFSAYEKGSASRTGPLSGARKAPLSPGPAKPPTAVRVPMRPPLEHTTPADRVRTSPAGVCHGPFPVQPGAALTGTARPLQHTNHPAPPASEPAAGAGGAGAGPPRRWPQRLSCASTKQRLPSTTP